MQFTSFSVDLLLDMVNMVLGVLQGLDELAALGCLSSQGGLDYIENKGTLLDGGLGGGELLFHEENVFFGPAEVIFGLKRSMNRLVQLRLLRQQLVIEAFKLSSESGHAGLALLVQSSVIFQAFLGLVNLLKRGSVACIILRVHHDGQFLIF